MNFLIKAKVLLLIAENPNQIFPFTAERQTRYLEIPVFTVVFLDPTGFKPEFTDPTADVYRCIH